jgi:DNA transposition AAA+ family ATPase
MVPIVMEPRQPCPGHWSVEVPIARYPQLYSLVGFVHHVRQLSTEELRFILAHKWEQLRLTFSPDDFADAEAFAAIARITGGNFLLAQRLFSQIERIMQINELGTITKEVVETDRVNLVIGSV